MFRKIPHSIFVFAVLLLVSCSVLAAPVPFPASVSWYNVEQPLNWEALEGRAVLLDFFTPGCINCVHMLPVEEELAARFGKRLVIIGIDSPKFTNSGTESGLRAFMAVHDIRHPIVLDTHHRIWDAWHVFAWPMFFLVGPKGNVLERFIGEQSVADLAEPIAEALENAPPSDALEPLPLDTMALGGSALEAPGGIAVSDNLVAVSDTGHDRIVLATKTGELKAVVGNTCVDGSDGGYDQAEFSRPHGLTFHDGRLYVADTQGQRIRVVHLQSRQVTTLAGSGERAYVPAGQYPAMEAELNSPWDVQWGDDYLYISMAGDHAIWRYDPTTKQIGVWAGTSREGLSDGDLKHAEFAQPSGLDWHAGTLYVAGPESSSIRAIDINEGEVSTAVGQGLFRFGFRDGKARAALLQHAEDVIWYDDSLYIADTFNNALRRLNLKTMRVSTVARDLAHPQALAVLKPGKLLIVESGGDRIDVINLKTGEVEPWLIEGLESPSAACGDGDGDE